MEPTIDSSNLIKADQAARILTISVRKLWELTRMEKVPHLRIGRTVRYDPDDLLAWIETQKKWPKSR